MLDLWFFECPVSVSRTLFALDDKYGAPMEGSQRFEK